MGCFGGDREKLEPVKAEHQWSFINLSDFTASSWLTPLSYGILYISLTISIACYVVDIFTCSQLLLFDKWSGQIQPVVPLYISRWVFTGCILLSLVLLVYRWIKAVRAIKSGGISRSYLDPLAVRLQSARTGSSGRGWRRFLVFAELTKSRKGVEYVALFTYFSFEAWVRIIFAEGPRQAINAMTLAALMKEDVVPLGDHAAKGGNSPAGQFFVNLQIIANQDNLRAAVLFGMLFTVIIWFFAALSLAISCILYVVFLWHHIPSQEGGLRKFCKRKIEGRLQRIVDAKIMKALAKEDMKRAKEEAKGGDFKPYMKKQPTLPSLDDPSSDKLSEMPSLSRATTISTLPEYTTSPTEHPPMPDLARQPTLPGVAQFPSRPPTRSTTDDPAPDFGRQSALPDLAQYPSRPPTRSTTSYDPAPGPAGQPTLPALSQYPHRPPPTRSTTQSSQRSYASSTTLLNSSASTMSRPGTVSTFREPVRRGTNSSAMSPHSQFTPRPYPPPSRALSSMSGAPPPARRQNTQTSGYEAYRTGSASTGPSRQASQASSYEAYRPGPASTGPARQASQASSYSAWRPPPQYQAYAPSEPPPSYGGQGPAQAGWR